MALLPLAMFLLFEVKDFVSCKNPERQYEDIYAPLGEPLVLNCTYNCSFGFIRGYWLWEKTPECTTCYWEKRNVTITGGLCTLPLYTRNLTVEHTLYNYSCFSEESDNPSLPYKTERLISLQVQGQSIGPVTTQREGLPDLPMEVMVYNDNTEGAVRAMPPFHLKAVEGASLKLNCRASENSSCEGQWVRENGTLPWSDSRATLSWIKIKEEDAGSYRCQALPHCSKKDVTITVEVIKHGRVKIVAAITVAVAAVLAAWAVYCCYCYTRKSNVPEQLTAVICERSALKDEVGEVTSTATDCQSDHEVPYADIVITVRGSSTPELSGIPNWAPGDQRLRWEEAGPGSLLHACRSADRLHVRPREVTRKLSTTSEYAIITYSTEALN